MGYVLCVYSPRCCFIFDNSTSLGSSGPWYLHSWRSSVFFDYSLVLCFCSSLSVPFAFHPNMEWIKIQHQMIKKQCRYELLAATYRLLTCTGLNPPFFLSLNFLIFHPWTFFHATMVFSCLLFSPFGLFTLWSFHPLVFSRLDLFTPWSFHPLVFPVLWSSSLGYFILESLIPWLFSCLDFFMVLVSLR